VYLCVYRLVKSKRIKATVLLRFGKAKHERFVRSGKNKRWRSYGVLLPNRFRNAVVIFLRSTLIVVLRGRHTHTVTHCLRLTVSEQNVYAISTPLSDDVLRKAYATSSKIFLLFEFRNKRVRTLQYFELRSAISRFDVRKRKLSAVPLE